MKTNMFKDYNTDGGNKNIMKNTNRFSEHPPICHLPRLIQKCAEVFTGKDECELFIYSIITALSGLLTKVSGVYAQKVCYPNMFFMALAPAASGKGAMGYSRQALQRIHKYYFDKSLQAQKEYNKKSKKTRGNPPPFKIVFLPGNTSSSKMLQHLSDNAPDIPLIMFETEMDTVNRATNSEHGQFSDILRKDFQNEPVSQTRRMNNEYFDIEKPKIAIVISGTPGQLFKFINNREDGLLSRFLVMNFKNNDGWKPVSPCADCINLSEFFNTVSEEFFQFYEYISKDQI
ncbi:MAG: DUF3987 domain-containing protein [Ginsengibacter sp.]